MRETSAQVEAIVDVRRQADAATLQALSLQTRCEAAELAIKAVEAQRQSAVTEAGEARSLAAAAEARRAEAQKVRIRISFSLYICECVYTHTYIYIYTYIHR